MPQTHVPLRRRQKQGTAQVPAILLDQDQDTGLFSPADDVVALAIGGDEALRFDPAGQMGLGTPSPQELLHVNGVIATNSYIALGRNAANHVRLVNSSGTLHLRNQNNSADAHLIVGNLTVTGDFTTTTSNTVELGDEFIVLNNDYTGGSPFADAGIKVERGTETNASLLWDESSDRWKAGFLGSEAIIWTSATDGAGSGLDADLLDGQQGSYYRAWANLTGIPNLAVRDSNQTISGTWTFQAKPRLDGNGLLLQSEGGAPGGTLGYVTLHGEASGLWATIGTGSAFRMLTTDDSSSFATSGHTHALTELSNVTAPSPGDGYALVWSDTNSRWEPGQISTVTSLAQLTDTTLSSPSTGQFLRYTGSVWANATLTTSHVSDWATAWDTRLGTKDTGDLSEGSNLYYTAARVTAALAAGPTLGGNVTFQSNASGDTQPSDEFTLYNATPAAGGMDDDTAYSPAIRFHAIGADYDEEAVPAEWRIYSSGYDNSSQLHFKERRGGTGNWNNGLTLSSGGHLGVMGSINLGTTTGGLGVNGQQIIANDGSITSKAITVQAAPITLSADEKLQWGSGGAYIVSDGAGVSGYLSIAVNNAVIADYVGTIWTFHQDLRIGGITLNESTSTLEGGSAAFYSSSSIDSVADAIWTLDRGSAGNSSGFKTQVSGTDEWSVHATGTNLNIYSYTTAANAVQIAKATGAVTLSDNLTINGADVLISAGQLTIANNQELRFKDFGGTSRQALKWDASDNMAIGTASPVMNRLYVYGGTNGMRLYENGNERLDLHSTGVDVTGNLDVSGTATLTGAVSGAGFVTAVDARITAQKGAANGLATLDGTSKIPSSLLPALVLTETSVVANQTAQLALTAQEGDVAVRSDENKSYIHLGTSNGDMTDWQELLSPTDAVLSVNGYTGAVTLAKSDFGLGNVENTALSTWAGSSNLTTVGTISSGTWQGSAIAASYISMALTDLSNVTAGSPTDGYALVWSDTNSRWEPGQVAGVTSLAALTDTTISSPQSGEVLRFNGSEWINDTFSISFADGTVTAPSITNAGDTNTGLFFPAADHFAVTTAGAKRSSWDEAGNFYTTGQTSEIARTSQDGFMYVGTMEQAPLSAPNTLPAGTAPLVIDRGTHSIYAYYDGAWHAVGRGVGAPATYGLTLYNEGDYVQ